MTSHHVHTVSAEPRIHRRKFLKLSLALGALCLGAPLYAGIIEVSWLETTRLTLRSPRLPTSFDGMRIVHISDLHFGHHFDLSQLDVIIGRVEALKPDLLCFTGDLIDDQLSITEAKSIARRLQQCNPPLGKFAVLGNHDYFGDVALVKQALSDGGFHVLINQVYPLVKGTDTLYLSGLDDHMEGQPDLEAVLAQLPNDPHAFHLLLAHEPDSAATHRTAPIDLQLSGHSHGGQIRLPFLGAPITPPGGRRYPAGLYRLNERFALYTNRGIGTTILPLRFLCRPEITVLELKRG
jgi:predicted MPP superfamily phosphohydrolase